MRRSAGALKHLDGIDDPAAMEAFAPGGEEGCVGEGVNAADLDVFREDARLLQQPVAASSSD